MTPDMIIVLLVMLGAVILFASEKVPVDLVAGLVLVTLVLSGQVTVTEGLAGFSNPATITVAAMFVLSAGLERTGAVSAIGRLLVATGRTPSLLLLAVMVSIAAVSAFINNTAAVAVFLPLVLGAAATRKVPASRLLIPLSYASQFGGVCTLIGSSTNLLVNSIAVRSGLESFGMFEFARAGWILSAVGLVFLLVIGRWLIPERRGEPLAEAYQLGKYIAELRLTPDSPLIGKTVVEAELGSAHDVTVLELIRGDRKIWSPTYEPMRADDILLVRGEVESLTKLRGKVGFQIEPEFKFQEEALEKDDAVLLEAVVAPRSRWVGRTLADLRFHRRFNAVVLGLHRRGHYLREKLSNIKVRFGDAMLLLVPRLHLEELRRNENLIILRELESDSVNRRRAPLALAILGAVVVLAALNILPIVVTAIAGCAALLLTRCLDVEEAYEAVDMRVVMLLAGVLPLGVALEKSGAAALLADTTLQLVGSLGPVAVLAVFYLLTAVLTEVMSNNAAAALLAPVAITAASKLGVDPRPLLVAVTFAASTSFSTPVGYQTNTMVYSVGGYRFMDFMRAGVPLNLLFWAVSVWLIPKFWPF